MLPIEFPERNMVYQKPKDWTDEQCSDLCVWKGSAPIDDKGNTAPTIISCWKPSKEDIDSIKAGNPIWLLLTAEVQCPVSIQTESPFT